MLGAGAVVCACALVLLGLARLQGFRSPLFAVSLHFTCMGAATWVDSLLAPRLDGRRFDVAPWEPRLYARLGVHVFRRGLRRIGWTHLTRDERIFDGRRGTLAAYEAATRRGENGHAWILAVALVPVVAAALEGWWDAVAWIGGLCIPLHVYPILLQRTQRARLLTLLRRVGASSVGAQTDAP